MLFCPVRPIIPLSLLPLLMDRETTKNVFAFSGRALAEGL